MRFGTCQPNNMFIILIRHWEESRPSSRISGLLSNRHMLIDIYIYMRMTYIYAIYRRICKQTRAVVFGAEGRQSETSVPGERLHLRNGVFKLRIYYVTDD